MTENQNSKELIEKLHEEAVQAGNNHYNDPKTGYMVFTAEYHKKRGHCCESGCRHCPYGFKKERSKPPKSYLELKDSSNTLKAA